MFRRRVPVVGSQQHYQLCWLVVVVVVVAVGAGWQAMPVIQHEKLRLRPLDSLEESGSWGGGREIQRRGWWCSLKVCISPSACPFSSFRILVITHEVGWLVAFLRPNPPDDSSSLSSPRYQYSKDLDAGCHNY